MPAALGGKCPPRWIVRPARRGATTQLVPLRRADPAQIQQAVNMIRDAALRTEPGETLAAVPVSQPGKPRSAVNLVSMIFQPAARRRRRHPPTNHRTRRRKKRHRTRHRKSRSPAHRPRHSLSSRSCPPHPARRKAPSRRVCWVMCKSNSCRNLGWSSCAATVAMWNGSRRSSMKSKSRAKSRVPRFKW